MEEGQQPSDDVLHSLIRSQSAYLLSGANLPVTKKRPSRDDITGGISAAAAGAAGKGDSNDDGSVGADADADAAQRRMSRESRQNHSDMMRALITAEEESAASGGHDNACCGRLLDEVLSFLYSLQATGAILSLIILFKFGIINSGPAVMVFGWLGATLFAAIVVANLAEIAASYPRNPGSAYFWAGQLAPKEYATVVSYVTGVFILVAYHGYLASYAYGFALLLDASMSFSGLGTLNELEAVGVSLGALFVWSLVAYFKVDYHDWMSHVSAFTQITVAVAITLAVTVTCKSFNTPEFVFLSVSESNVGSFPQIEFILAISVISQFYPLSEFSAKKGAIHVFEEMEVEHVSSSMGLINTGIVTGVLGFALLLALLFTMESRDAVVAAENGAFEVIQHTAGHIATMFFGWYLVVAGFFAGMSFVPVSIKLTHALALDSFFPFSEYWIELDSRSFAANAALLTFLLSACILAFDVLEDLDGGQIFYSILQTQNFSFQVAFGIPVFLKVTCMCPVAARTIQKSAFSLQGWSFPLGCVASFFLFSTSILLNVPTNYPITLEKMNFTSVVIAFIVLLGYINWECYAKYHFTGPKRPLDDMDLQYYMEIGDSDSAVHVRGPPVTRPTI